MNLEAAVGLTVTERQQGERGPVESGLLIILHAITARAGRQDGAACSQSQAAKRPSIRGAQRGRSA